MMRRQNLRAANLHPNYSDNENIAGDSSLKKNTAMVSKLKSIDNTGRLAEELCKLKFDKFLTEMINSITGEAVLKVKSQADAIAIIEVCSVLHQRSPEFAVRFAGELLHQLVPPSKPLADAKAEQNRINQQKAVFRVFVDSVLAGIISTGIACAMIPSIIGASKNATKTEIKLKEWFERDGGIILWLINSLIKGDLSEHSNCHFVILLVKSYNELLSSSDAAVESSSDLIDKAVQEALTALLKDYADSVFSRLVKEHSTLQKMRKHNQEHLITRGELSDQQKAKFEAAERSFTSILQIAEILAESLSMEMPRLSGEEGGFAVTIADPSAKFAEHLSKDWHETPWEDEECKSFYTDIPDLLNFVPRIYLVDEVKQLKKKRIRGNRKRQDDDLDDDFMENVDQELLDSVESTIEREDAESAAVNTKQASVITPIDAFNQRLPNLISQKLVDEAAVEFCHLRHGSPAIAQSKLIQTIVDVPRHRIDLLPYYARLLANLYPFIPEIGNTVVACLHSEFRRRFRKQTQFHLEHRIKNVRFLGELVKFRICATHIIFYCFKRLTQPESSGGSFDSSNAEVACALLDACGRYMLKIPEISIKFSPLVEIMQKKVKAANFDSRILLIFENAMIVSNPQPVIETRKQEKRRTPLDLYLRNLIYTTLRRDNAEKILHSIRSLPWSKRVEQTTEEINMADNTVPMSQSLGADSSKFVNVHKNVEKIFVKIWKVKFPLVETMASILAGLSKYHPSLVVDVIDSILEQVRFGMEDLTHFRHQQRRITTIHYVGQLCNYRIVPPLVIIDLLYLIIYFGHSYNDIPCPNEDPVCIIDPPAEFFRVRLVCELIQTCGVQFERSQLLPQFNRFMAIFLCYFLSKDSDSMIQEIDLMIKSTLSAFWAHKVPGTFEEAKAILYYIESGSLTSDSSANTVANAEKAITDEFVDDISSTSCSDDISSESESFSSESESENSESPSSLEISSSSEAPSDEEDAELITELQKVLTESVESRKSEKRMLDLALPMQIRANAAADTINSGDHMSFAVMTKRNTRGPLKTINIPLSSQFAALNLSNQEAKEAEKRELKRVVLRLESERI